MTEPQRGNAVVVQRQPEQNGVGGGTSPTSSSVRAQDAACASLCWSSCTFPAKAADAVEVRTRIGPEAAVDGGVARVGRTPGVGSAGGELPADRAATLDAGVDVK